MRLVYTVAVEVDPEAWQALYGKQRGLREDVKAYVVKKLTESPAAEAEALTSVRAQ